MDELGGDGHGVTFGTELRRLRQAKKLSLADLADLLRTGKGYLSRLERGLQRPSEQFARACDRVLDAGGALVALAVGPSVGVCPYPGLAPFRTEEARWFFGRERAVSELVCLLGDPSTAGQPVVLIGPSGVGKSSLLRAGLAPAVARGGLPGCEPGTPSVLYLTPTVRPMSELRAHEEQRPLDSHALLIVDQFEELFTLCGDVAERDAFSDKLSQLACTGLSVVVAVRADFYAHCLSHPGLREALRTRSLPLGPMSRTELRQAITEPAAATGLALEPGLAEVLLRDLGAHAGEAGALPLLSHALRATWQHRVDSVLTVAGYEHTGGVHGAVATTAERAYARLSAPEREAARTVLLALVRIGEGIADTRRRADRHELVGDAQTQAVVEEFTKSRLLTADDGHVEISHEALLRAWPRLKEWIEANRVGLLLRQRLADDAVTWDAAGRDESHLYRGSRLAAADGPCVGVSLPSGTVEQEFLTASRRLQRRGIRRSRQLIALLATLVVATAASAGAAVYQAQQAVRQADEAVSSRLATEADAVRASDPALAAQLAVVAFRAADSDRARSALVGSSAAPYATRYLSGTPTVTTSWGASPDGRILAEGTREGSVQLWDTQQKRPRPVTFPVGKSAITHVAVHPKHVLALAMDTGPVQLWDVHDPRWPTHLRDLDRGQGAVSAMEFSADGSRLAFGDVHGRLTLWNTADPHRPTSLHTWQSGDDHILDLAVDHDGRRLAAVDGGHEAAVWNLTDPAHPQQHAVAGTSGNERFQSAAISPDGDTLALVDATVTEHRVLLAPVTDAGAPKALRQLYASASTVNDVAFSPDGTALALGDVDAHVEVLKVPGTEGNAGPRTTWRMGLPQPDQVVGLAFGPDNTTLSVGTGTGGSRVWHPLPPLAGHSATLTALETNQDRDLAITTSKDGTAMLWRIPSAGAPRPLNTPLNCGGTSLSGAAFSPDSRTIALTTEVPGNANARDPSTWAAVCLWDISVPEHPHQLNRTLIGSANQINQAAFSADGRTLVTGAFGHNELLVWDVTHPAAPRQRARLPVQGVTSVAFLGTSAVLAVGTTRTGVQLWDLSTPEAARLITRLQGAPNAADLSTDRKGRILAAGSYDQRVYLWDVTHPAAPALLPLLQGHKGTVWQVDLDASGKHLITTNGMAPGPTRLWDLSNARRPRQTTAIEGTTGIGVFTKNTDGFLITTSDHALRRWSTDARSIVQRLCETAGSPLTGEEEKLYATEYLGTPCR